MASNNIDNAFAHQFSFFFAFSLCPSPVIH